MKKILILSGSSRRGGNSDLLCDEFARGARESGHEVEKIRVAAKTIAPCSACYFCREHHGQCVHQDDLSDVLQKMIDADVLVLASPVYFYAIDAQLKAVIDRTVTRWRCRSSCRLWPTSAGAPAPYVSCWRAPRCRRYARRFQTSSSTSRTTGRAYLIFIRR